MKIEIPGGLLVALAAGAGTWFLHKEKIIPRGVEKAAIKVSRLILEDMNKHSSENIGGK